MFSYLIKLGPDSSLIYLFVVFTFLYCFQGQMFLTWIWCRVPSSTLPRAA